MSSEQITIPKLTAQVLFDAVVGTMDFGSDMFDSEEVEALRGLAVALGVNPIKGTPPEFVKHYPHPFKSMTDPLMIARVFDMVRAEWNGKAWVSVPGPGKPPHIPCHAGAYPYCQKPESDPIHQLAEAG